jgi:hypothetical protein
MDTPWFELVRRLAPDPAPQNVEIVKGRVAAKIKITKTRFRKKVVFLARANVGNLAHLPATLWAHARSSFRHCHV